MKNKGKFSLLACLLLTLGLATACSGTSDTSSSPTSSTTSSTTDSSTVSSTVDSSSSSSAEDKSSAEPEEVFYDLSFTLDEGITATFTVGGETVTSATEGSIVVISYTLDSEYELVSFTSEQVTISQTAGQYHFTMPASAVEVVATTSAKPTYGIDVITTEGVESVVLAVNGTEVTSTLAGSTVMVTITIADRYTFSSISLDNGSLTTLKYGVSYSFTMPASSVTLNVAAEFVPNEHKLASLTVIDPDNITDVSIEAGATLLERDEVTFTFNGADGLDYRAEVTDENGDPVASTIAKTSSEETEYLDNAQEYKVSFIMPDADVDITLSSWAFTANDGATITINESGAGHYQYYGITSGQKYNSGVTLFVVPESGYLPTVTSDQATITQNGNAYTIEFTDATAVTINITSEYTGVADITLAEGSHATLTGQTTGITVGSTVNLTAVADDGYLLNGATVADTNGAPVASTFDTETGSLSFTMPEGGAVVTIETLSIIALTYQEAVGVSDVVITNTEGEEITQTVTGAEVLIHFNFDEENYRLDSVLLGDVKATDVTTSAHSEKDKVFKAIVIDTGEFTFDVSTKHTISFDDDRGYYYTVLEEPDTKAAVGETVRFRIKPELGYAIDLVYTSGPDVADEGSGWYSFTMPNSNVLINVVTETSSTTTLNFTGTGYINLKIVDEWGDELTADETVNVGTEISFTFDVEDGYGLDSVTYGDTTLEADADGWYTFTAAADTTVTITASEQASDDRFANLEPGTITVYNETSYTCVFGTASSLIYGNTGAALASGSSVTENTTVYVYANLGYDDGAVNVTVETANEIILEKELSYSGSYGRYTSFTMPADAVIITFTTPTDEQASDDPLASLVDGTVTIDNQTSYTCLVGTNYNVVWGASSYGLASGSSVDEGSTVYAAASLGYGASCYVKVESKNGEIIEETQLTYGYGTNNCVQFTMPAEGVLVTFYV